MNIAIMMSVWCQNLWDELILKNEVKQLENKYWKDSKFKVFTYDLEKQFILADNIKYLEYFPIWIKNPKNIFRNIKNYLNFIRTIIWADKIVIGGWWIIFDNEVWNYSNPLNQWLFRTSIMYILKKNIIFWGISIDIKNSKNLFKIKSIFSKASEVYVRDNLSFVVVSRDKKEKIYKDKHFYYKSDKINRRFFIGEKRND